MKGIMEDTQIEHVVAPPTVGAKTPRWEKPLLMLVIALAAALMIAWLAFLGWVASLLLFAVWP